MENNTTKKTNTIKPRKSVDDTIFQELAEKYPLESSKNGVEYEVKLEYLTFETDFFDATMRNIITQVGSDAIAVLFFFRSKMCPLGWRVRIDGIYGETLISDCAYICHIPIEKVKTIVSVLVKNKILFTVKDERYAEGTYACTTQQIFNFEMTANNRKRERERKAAQRKKNKIDNQNLDENNALFETLSDDECPFD